MATHTNQLICESVAASEEERAGQDERSLTECKVSARFLFRLLSLIFFFFAFCVANAAKWNKFPAVKVNRRGNH